MAERAYLDGRQKYSRPQAMVFAESYSQDPITGIITPGGDEILATPTSGEDFIILSDHNRAPIDVSSQRIGQRQRMINGRMRAYHIADKKVFTVSWDMLPSRSYALDPEFYTSGEQIGSSPYSGAREEYTADGGAGGIELRAWYDAHPDSFYVLLSYDNYNEFSTYDGDEYDRLGEYSEVREVFFSDFSYSVQKRGTNNHDFWSVSLSLEEV